MFAFLNNAHEANVAVYTPDEQMKRAEIFREIREIEDRAAAPAPRLAGADGRVGRAGRGRPARVDGRAARGRRRIDRRRRSTCLLDDGSFLAQGYAPTKHTRRVDGQDRRSRRSRPFRLELLNDPNLPLRRPGPVDQGDRAP